MLVFFEVIHRVLALTKYRCNAEQSVPGILRPNYWRLFQQKIKPKKEV